MLVFIEVRISVEYLPRTFDESTFEIWVKIIRIDSLYMNHIHYYEMQWQQTHNLKLWMIEKLYLSKYYSSR